MLLEYRGSAAAGTVSLRAVAVALTTSSNSTANPTSQPSVYTPGRSATSFILAMAAARSAYMAQVIFTGHLFNQHVLQVRLPCICVREGCVWVSESMCVCSGIGHFKSWTLCTRMFHHRATPMQQPFLGHYEMPS